jgi:hypothetical protein
VGRWLANLKIKRALSDKDKEGSWRTPPLNLGKYGTDYNTRAVVAMVGLGANLPEDAIYPNTASDQQGRALNGKHKYRIHFDAKQLPPIKAFWSITAYGANEFLIDNPLQRFALGDRDDLRYNSDGSSGYFDSSGDTCQRRHEKQLASRQSQRTLFVERAFVLAQRGRTEFEMANATRRALGLGC